MIFPAGEIQHLPKEVHCRLAVASITARQNVPGASHLEVDILQIVAFDDLYQLRAPWDVLGTRFRTLTIASAAGRSRIESRVVDDEVDIREILCNLFDVFGMAMFFVEQSERESLM